MNDELIFHVTNIMLSLGFIPKHYGFNYLREIICIAYAQQSYKLSEIYQTIAAAHDTVLQSVQTAVRNALKTAQRSESFNNINKLMQTRVTSYYPLSPNEFVSIMLEYLKYFWQANV